MPNVNTNALAPKNNDTAYLVRVHQANMSTAQFLKAHVKNAITGDTFTGPNQERKVLPDCVTPKNEEDPDGDISVEEKTELVLSDPKFGMFSLFAYHWTRGKDNSALKRRNTVFCSHIFSLVFALPIMVFITQWLMYIAILAYQVRSYDAGLCPNEATWEGKILMSSIALFYFIKSFFLWDNIVDRTHRKKMIPSTSYIVMMDTFQEFGFNLLVYVTNLWCIFATDDFMDMFFNTIAMEFLMEMDNEFQRAYFTYLPGVAEDIYDKMFVTYRENVLMVNQKTHDSCRFRCCKRITWLPFKVLILMFLLLPFICFAMIIFGAACK